MQRRRKLMAMQTGGLPGAYRRVEYLENSGTQYIETSYKPNIANIKTECVFMFTTHQSGDNYLYYMIENNGGLLSAECYNNTKWYVSGGLYLFNGVLHNVATEINYIHTLTTQNDLLTIDNNTVSSTGTRSKGTPNVLWIFCKFNITNITKGARIYKLTFSNEGSISADFIPCVRKSDSKPGMYDTVSKTFYTNAGTGEFIVPA